MISSNISDGNEEIINKLVMEKTGTEFTFGIGINIIIYISLCFYFIIILYKRQLDIEIL